VAWAQLIATVAQLEAEPVRAQAPEMIALVLAAGYEDWLEARYANAQARLEDLAQLARFSRTFATPAEFLAQVALMTDAEAEADRPGAGVEERLRLSTIHQAKGLEFGVVFVIMLCEGLFPAARPLKTKEGEEEERRLFYVAITRAKNDLYLSFPLRRPSPVPGSTAQQTRSRFLDEIPPELLEEWSLRNC
jgi:DNA helicase-2/ATP-dependent DNA helicase PcrA